MKKHPNELDLAALAGGDLSFFRRLRVNGHLRSCETCQDRVAGFRDLRGELTQLETPELNELNWDSLALEMRANIRLGLEAGECVREPKAPRLVSPGLIVAFASLILLVGAAFFLQDHRQLPVSPLAHNPFISGPFASAQPVPGAKPFVSVPDYRVPVIETSLQGVEMRSGEHSFAFLNHEGGAVNQTVSAEGAIRSRDIDGDAGTVTIRDVYLQ